VVFLQLFCRPLRDLTGFLGRLFPALKCWAIFQKEGKDLTAKNAKNAKRCRAIFEEG